MRILLLSSAFSGLTQRFYTELDDAGYTVSVELHLGDDSQLLEGVALFEPYLIISPFLTRKIPSEIYKKYITPKRLLSFTDATLIYLFQKLKADYIISFDSHFDNILDRKY